MPRNVAIRMAPKVLSMRGKKSTGGRGLEDMTEKKAELQALEQRFRVQRGIFILEHGDGPVPGLTITIHQLECRI